MLEQNNYNKKIEMDEKLIVDVKRPYSPNNNSAKMAKIEGRNFRF